ncbi:MAG: TRAP transporter permease [Geminicoccales bacterium]
MRRYASTESLLYLIALIFGVYHLLVVSGLFAVSTMQTRLIHLMLAFTLLFALKPLNQSRTGSVLSLVLTAAAIAASLWLLTRWKEIAFSGGLTETGDFYAGLVILVVVFEAARRGVGLVLASITFAFFAYPFVSPFLPGLLYSRGYSLERMVIFLTTDTQGVYGIPIGVASTYIIIFTIFGALLSGFGAGDFFFALSQRVTAGLRAASAKSAVIFSTLIGMVSGSAAGNVAVTGTLTIPIMKREGYPAHQAGAIEAVASTGGQLMPPVMGAAAFIMAEIVGVPYTSIMAAGLLPAILFFASAFCIVHFQGVKLGLEPAVSDIRDTRSLAQVLLEGFPFIASFITLIGMMITGYSPFKASLWAMLVLIGLDPIWKRKLDLAYLKKILDGIVEGAKGVVTISAACAAAGIIAGTLGITGLGSKIAVLIDLASGGYLLIALFFTMVTSIILGMGLPTTAAYLILATVVAPALVKLGVPMLTAHFFVFYYGCISTITPPVALAAYVAGGIAKADINKVGWTAAAYAITSFALPFAFSFGPGLLLQGGTGTNLLAVITGLIGTGAIAAAVVGCLLKPLKPTSRGLAAAGGACLLAQTSTTALVGTGLLICLAVIESRSRAMIAKP